MRSRPGAAVLAFACSWLAVSCGREKPVAPGAMFDGSVVPPDRQDAGLAADDVFQLLTAPLTFAPTERGFALNAVLRAGDPAALRMRVREQGQSAWTEIGAPALPAPDTAQWAVGGLAPGRRYQYEIRGAGAGQVPGDAAAFLAATPDAGGDGNSFAVAAGPPLHQGSAVTARDPGSAFTFAVLSDTHIAPRDPVPAYAHDIVAGLEGFQENTLRAVTGDMVASRPDFLINLGDTLDFHQFGFNTPPPDTSWTRLGYLNYRRLLGPALRDAAHFPVVGNWDGENGCNTAEEIQRSLSQRLLYLPGPGPTTYSQGGSANGDYYSFTWGDALFVVLNVMTYTPTCHLLGGHPGFPDDWTLGAAQLAWLDRTLAGATAKWRFLFIHHAVGGAAGDYDNSAYGRGGGQAARVGEQSVIHDLMIKHGVQIFFYGHDHVFADMVVDGIHYTLPGSAGAPWKFASFETGYSQFWPDSGYGRIQVRPDAVQVDFVALGGALLSSFVVR